MNTFVTGCAGTGKTYQCKQEIAANPRWGLLCATTGIASINLDTVTLNSSIGYFDTASLIEIQEKGELRRKLLAIKEDSDRLVIDEISMMDGNQLTILTREAAEVGLPIYLTGDFLQLPPVKADWAFQSPEWQKYESNTTRLTKVYRQDAGSFLDALNHARAGRGKEAADILSQERVQWNSDLVDDYPGTTLMAKNDAVTEFNQKAMDKLSGREITLQNRRWGRQRAEFKQIPDQLTLKEGALVMLLSNRYDDQGDMVYANGDLGWMVSPKTVRLKRTGEEVDVLPVLREVSRKHRPKPWFRPCYGSGWTPSSHWNAEKQKFIEGQIQYYPLRLAYASTIHRCQGLTLDAIQFDFRDQFASQPAMMYVALSRCKTLEGLRLVGDRERFVKYCRIDPKVRRWL